MLNSSSVDWIHLDIMDGVFVPNISFGFSICEEIKKISRKPLEAHLMIMNPERYIKRIAECGVDLITIHIEACSHLHRTVQKIKQENCKVGIAINPSTPIGALEYIIEDIYSVCLMSVNPGFGNQTFIPSTFNKIKHTTELIRKYNSNTYISIDGGVNKKNALGLSQSGAEILVIGSYIFNSENPMEAIEELRELERTRKI